MPLTQGVSGEFGVLWDRIEDAVFFFDRSPEGDRRNHSKIREACSNMKNLPDVLYISFHVPQKPRKLNKRNEFTEGPILEARCVFVFPILHKTIIHHQHRFDQWLFYNLDKLKVVIELVNKLNYFYFISLKSFHTRASWSFFTEAWVRGSLLKSPGLFSVF